MPLMDSWYALPPDVNAWQSVIVENLSRKVPEIPKYISGIEITKIDPLTGNADGLVYLLKGLAGVPITIRQNKLAPLDVMVTKNEEFFPVTEAFLQKVYADNVIGEPSKDPYLTDDLQQDGPARRIQHYQTVDRIKYASYEAKLALKAAVEKSASMLTYFAEKQPELLGIILNPEAPVEKKASEDEKPMPEVMYLAKEGSTYYFNGEAVSLEEAAEFMKVAGLDDVEKDKIMRGGCVCIDSREKHAALQMPVATYNEASPDDKRRQAETSPASLVTVMTLDGVPRRGFLWRNNEGLDCPQTIGGPLARKPELAKHIFVTDDFHAIQDDLYIMDKTPAELKDVRNVSVASDPMVGDFGIIMDDWNLRGPFEIASVMKNGSVTIVKALSGLEGEQFTLGAGQEFYEIPKERKELVRNPDSAMLAMPGENWVVGVDGDGNMVLQNKAYEYANGVYALMVDADLDLQDALHVSEAVKTAGRLMFKTAKPVDPNKKETDTENNPTNADGESTGQPSPNDQFMVGAAGVDSMKPVNFDDIEDIAKINDPNMMDAYLSGKLVDVNTAGREQIMQVSDDLLAAIKSLGKVLYLVRLGQIDYVKEEDAQMALNKLSDVARSLGISSAQMF